MTMRGKRKKAWAYLKMQNFIFLFKQNINLSEKFKRFSPKLASSTVRINFYKKTKWFLHNLVDWKSR